MENRQNTEESESKKEEAERGKAEIWRKKRKL